jgi:hypothetical protein
VIERESIIVVSNKKIQDTSQQVQSQQIQRQVEHHTTSKKRRRKINGYVVANKNDIDRSIDRSIAMVNDSYRHRVMSDAGTQRRSNEATIRNGSRVQSTGVGSMAYLLIRENIRLRCATEK